jgi:HD-GYP domain-containing protein (c-di-GMP phosphodiesterase class II)
MSTALADPLQLLQELTAIGTALSAEKNHQRLLELILEQAERMTNADGGTLYSVTDDGRLQFEIMHTQTLGIHLGGTSGKVIPFPPLPLKDSFGLPNTKMVAAYAAISRQTVNIDDAYFNEDFDFSGTRTFDQKTGYRSKSFLTVPMTNHENEVIGVLQLINKRDPNTDFVESFPAADQKMVECLASMAAVTVTNKQLINAQRELFDAFIQLIADAIDEKSPYTAGHCRRVPVLTMMIADAAASTTVGPLAGFRMTEEDRYELSVAAWLHDCGKIATPEFVVDKATKLETIFDRMKMIDTRFEVLKRDAEIAALRSKLKALGASDDLSANGDLDACRRRFDDDREFLRRCNLGGEFLADADRERVNAIAAYRWRDESGTDVPFLTENEVYNLQIGRGTLTGEERQVINNHINVTIKMLEALPYPKHLRRVPEYAGGHHERMDGKGYPRGLTREQMSLQARMMAIADIFEALTAKDRPYKAPMPLSKALAILARMKLDHHVDPDLFDVFVHEKVYLQYAEKFLMPEQIDAFDVNALPGYQPH